MSVCKCAYKCVYVYVSVLVTCKPASCRQGQAKRKNNIAVPITTWNTQTSLTPIQTHTYILPNEESRPYHHLEYRDIPHTHTNPHTYYQMKKAAHINTWNNHPQTHTQRKTYTHTCACIFIGRRNWCSLRRSIKTHTHTHTHLCLHLRRQAQLALSAQEPWQAVSPPAFANRCLYQHWPACPCPPCPLRPLPHLRHLRARKHTHRHTQSNVCQFQHQHLPTLPPSSYAPPPPPASTQTHTQTYTEQCVPIPTSALVEAYLPQPILLPSPFVLPLPPASTQTHTYTYTHTHTERERERERERESLQKGHATPQLFALPSFTTADAPMHILMHIYSDS